MHAVGYADFSLLDVLVLHNPYHSNRKKRRTDICFFGHIEGQHTVNYSLKKFTKTGLVGREKHCKEIFYQTTTAEKEACSRYREIRGRRLTSACHSLAREGTEIIEAGALLSLISGLYDPILRATCSL